jgi:hypothetical protein
VDNVAKPTKTLLDYDRSITGIQFYADLSNLYEAMPTPTA